MAAPPYGPMLVCLCGCKPADATVTAHAGARQWPTIDRTTLHQRRCLTTWTRERGGGWPDHRRID
eukprot:15484788-Alexandrium_andersonii.AAC.1